MFASIKINIILIDSRSRGGSKQQQQLAQWRGVSVSWHICWFWQNCQNLQKVLHEVKIGNHHWETFTLTYSLCCLIVYGPHTINYGYSCIKYEWIWEDNCTWCHDKWLCARAGVMRVFHKQAEINKEEGLPRMRDARLHRELESAVR